MLGEMRLEALRSLDDFLLESARFQLPTQSTWIRRLKGNLLYYQSNYFLLLLVIFILLLFMRPTEVMTGLLVVLGLLACIWGAGEYPGTRVTVNDFRNNHPYIMSTAAIGLIYLLLSLLGALAIFALAILLPVFIALIHGSLRLRNIRNKISNQLDKAGIKKTPMGFFLDQVGTVLEEE